MVHVRTFITGSFVLATALAVSACDKGSGGSGSGSGSTGAAPTNKPVAASEKPAPTGSGAVKGTVKLAGAVPAAEPWGGTNDSNCRSKQGATIQLVRAQDGKLEDAFVYVKAGLPEGSHSVPAPLVLDQKACEFAPRVIGVVAGQTVELVNSDAFLHNVKAKGEFNDGLPGGAKRTRTFENPGIVDIMCDVHPWMRAYAHVLPHPYFAVTRADGAFEIKGLVDGEYTVAVWHEKLGTQEKKVKVAGAAPVEVDFELAAK